MRWLPGRGEPPYAHTLLFERRAFLEGRHEIERSSEFARKAGMVRPQAMTSQACNALWAAATLACAGGLYPVLAFQNRLAPLPARGGPRAAGGAIYVMKRAKAWPRQQVTHRTGRRMTALGLGCHADSSADAEPVHGDNAREPFELINDPAHEELRQWARGSHSEKCAHRRII